MQGGAPSLKDHHILILPLGFLTVINCLAAHGIMFSKRLMVLINQGLNLKKKKKIHSQNLVTFTTALFPSKLLIFAM